jgi:hypothetical protein
MDPVLDVCGCGHGQKCVKGFRVVANKDILIDGKDKVSLGMEEFHFGAEAAVSGLVLSLKIMAVNRLISFLPNFKECGPNYS